MICLSKADEHAVRHLSYNQSPSPLAASHTTCQDLNGISNLREYVSADQDEGGGGGGGLFGAAALDEKLRRESQADGPDIAAADAGRWLPEPSSHTMAVAGPHDRRRPFWAPASGRASSVWSCVAWFASVLIVSSVLSFYNINALWTFSSSGHDTVGPLSGATPLETSVEHEAVAEPTRHRRKRESTCASGGVDKRDYNLPLHVGALFIILFVSFMGCAFPLLASKFPGLRIPARFFFVVRHFGTGVLIATAFVHLLPTAFISLGDPCLGSFWVTDYPAMPGAIALAAVFLVAVIEMVFHPSRHVPPAQIVSSRGGQGCMSNINFVASEAKDKCCSGHATQHPVRDMGPLGGRQSSVAQGLTQLHRSTSGRIQPAHQGNQEDSGQDKAVLSDSAEEDSLEVQTLSPDQKARKDRLQCILLEMGILFHSVFIGMALSVSIGNEFIILLIAIIFHQTFEGLALGSRIAAVQWEKETIQPWLMALAYGCTTPLGQAIGLATHTLYSPDSEAGLILVGVMNAISAGLLTFASLVELLSEDFLSDASWRYLRGRQRVYACLLVFFGAFGMSLVGAWA